MPSNYPSSPDIFTSKIDNFDDVMAADINNLQDAVAAIQSLLGAPPLGYYQIAASGTYVNATSFTIPGNLTVFLAGFAKFRCANSGTKYGHILSSSYNAGTNLTTANLVPNSNFSLTSAAITNIDISYGNPPDFPKRFSWTPAFSGFSGAVSGTSAFSISNGNCHIIMDVAGPSNATTFTVTLPIVPGINGNILVRVLDNSAIGANTGLLGITNGNLTANVYPLLGGGSWTTSNNKGFLLDGFYGI